eukprot:3650691-Ditylum_brightwellii.AAC.1
MWAWELSKVAQKFVITYNTRIRYRESTESLDMPSRFKAILRDDKNPSDRRKKYCNAKLVSILVKEKKKTRQIRMKREIMSWTLT